MPEVPAQSAARQVLGQVPSLRGARQITALHGGLTNQNFRVVTDAGVFVARMWSDGGDLLGIDREHEYRNSVLAAAAGVGAPVIEYRPQDRVLVLGFVEGRTLGNDDVAGLYGGVDALPATLLIGRDGKVVSTHNGVVDRIECEKELQTLLAAK